MTHKIQFLLNDQMINLTDLDPNATVLQYLREYQLKTGTKEGCGSGDCGACTVVIAELIPYNTTLSYKSINACITLVGSLHGKQLITVEHLKKSKCAGKPQLHPVQKHMVDNHASQCGFCTPGIVMSCYALHKNNQTPDRKEVVEALAGNLCRCTGYRSIIDAAMQPTADIDSDTAVDENQAIIKQLESINSKSSLDFHSENKAFYSPKNVQELSDYLLDNPASTLVSGGTDLALNITQNLAEIERLVYLGNVAELNELVEKRDSVTIGSAVTYDKFESVLGKTYPELGKMIERIGSTQIRNTGTLGGNVGNASPIGDMPPALIALNSSMTLQLGSKTREIAVEDYFTGYKQTLLNKSEFIRSFRITKPTPKPNSNQLLKVYKVSKRFDDDISAVLVACFLELEDQQVNSIRIAFGGMAAIPMRAKNCEAALLGKAFDQQNIDRAKQALENDFSPMSDVRASAEYRIKVAQNIIQRFFLEITDNTGQQRVVDYA